MDEISSVLNSQSEIKNKLMVTETYSGLHQLSMTKLFCKDSSRLLFSPKNNDKGLPVSKIHLSVF